MIRIPRKCIIAFLILSGALALCACDADISQVGAQAAKTESSVSEAGLEDDLSLAKSEETEQAQDDATKKKVIPCPKVAVKTIDVMNASEEEEQTKQDVQTKQVKQSRQASPAKQDVQSGQTAAPKQDAQATVKPELNENTALQADTAAVDNPTVNTSTESPTHESDVSSSCDDDTPPDTAKPAADDVSDVAHFVSWE